MSLVHADPPDAGPVTGIVLAGGRSSRFGSDKLRAEVRGRPLLDHAILALATCCDTVLVVVSSEGPAPSLPRDAGVPVLVVRDPVAGAGPLAGLVAGLEAAAEGVVLVVAGDQPDLRPELLRLLVAALGTASAAVLADADAPRPLPLCVRRGTALLAASAALATDRRSLLEVALGLRPVIVPEAAWRAADPDAAWQRDVDRPEDLAGH